MRSIAVVVLLATCSHVLAVVRLHLYLVVLQRML